jgi:hypothetical protein
MAELEQALQRLLVLAGRDLHRACAQFDVLVALHGRAVMARALQDAAGEELASLVPN